MESEELSKELIDNPNAEEDRELADGQLNKVAGGSDLPAPGTEGTCPKSPNGGDHDWFLFKSWPDGSTAGAAARCTTGSLNSNLRSTNREPCAGCLIGGSDAGCLDGSGEAHAEGESPSSILWRATSSANRPPFAMSSS